MPLTREFKETIMLRVKQDPDFRQSLIVEATNALLDGDFETGKSLLRDYLNATESLPAIAGELKQNVKSIRRMVTNAAYCIQYARVTDQELAEALDDR